MEVETDFPRRGPVLFHSRAVSARAPHPEPPSLNPPHPSNKCPSRGHTSLVLSMVQRPRYLLCLCSTPVLSTRLSPPTPLGPVRPPERLARARARVVLAGTGHHAGGRGELIYKPVNSLCGATERLGRNSPPDRACLDQSLPRIGG